MIRGSSVSKGLLVNESLLGLLLTPAVVSTNSAAQTIATLRHYCSKQKDDKIDFGFKQVPINEKESMVKGVFDNVASKYDVMNDAMSLGMHRLWKDSFVQQVPVFPGCQHVDVAGGTGDIAFRVFKKLQAIEQQRGITKQVQKGEVTVVDINENMLQEGQNRAKKQGTTNGINWIVGSAEELPLPDACMDTFTIAFGIRNVTYRDQALKEAYRVLKTGGKFMCLEFSHVQPQPIASLYDAYSMTAIPALGKLIAGDADSYRYLVESIRKFPTQEEFESMIQKAGFKHTSYENLTFGAVAIHSGYKL